MDWMDGKIRIAGYEGKGPFSYWIRLRTWSRITHVAAIRNNNRIDSFPFQGVRFTKGIKTKFENCRVRIYEITTPLIQEEHSMMWGWLESKLGKQYDYYGVLGRLFKTKWQNPDDYFCSELTYEMFKYFGIYDDKRCIDEPWKVTPAMQINMSYLKQVAVI